METFEKSATHTISSIEDTRIENTVSNHKIIVATNRVANCDARICAVHIFYEKVLPLQQPFQTHGSGKFIKAFPKKVPQRTIYSTMNVIIYSDVFVYSSPPIRCIH